MSNFLLISKLFLINKFRKSLNKRNLRIILSIIISALIFIGLGIAFICYFKFHIKEDYLKIILNGLFFSLLILEFVLSFSMIVLFLFSNTDVNFFFSLPISTSSIFFAKLFMIYFNELITSGIILIISTIFLSLITHLMVVGYISIFFALIVLPFFGLFLAMVLSLPTLLIIRVLRGRQYLISFLTLFLVMIFWGLYAYLFYGPGKSLILSIFSQGIIPINFFINIAVNINLINNILIIIAIMLGCTFVTYFLGKYSYLKTAQASQEISKNIRLVSGFEVKSNVKSLIVKERKVLFRDYKRAVNSLMPCILCPIFVGMCIFFNVFVNNLQENITIFVSFLITILLGILTNQGAVTAFSFEGERFYFLKILPISVKDCIKAKKFIYRLIAIFCIILTELMVLIKYKNYIHLLAFFPFLIINEAFLNFAIYIDLSKPCLNWKNQRQLYKNNMNVVICIFSQYISSILISILTFVLLLKIEIENEYYLWLYFYLIISIVYLIFLLIMKNKLNKNADNFLNRINC